MHAGPEDKESTAKEPTGPTKVVVSKAAPGDAHLGHHVPTSHQRTCGQCLRPPRVAFQKAQVSLQAHPEQSCGEHGHV